MARRRIGLEDGRRAFVLAVGALLAERDDVDVPPADRTTIATAVRWALQLLEARAPGHTVEVRVPPFGAVQVVDGPRHTRGTPPNVIEMNAPTWIALAAGRLEWAEAVAAGRVSASGARADLAPLLPLHRA